jgi:uncharacterized protein DUF5916/cellulose/xylan binding protein with CBM9 domain
MRPSIPSLAALLALAAIAPELAGQADTAARASRLPPAQAFSVARATGPIRLDGALDDPGWQGTAEIPIQWEWTPGDNTRPPVASVRRLTFDASNLYVGCRGFDPHPEEIRARYFSRDDIERLVRDDHFLILLDPFNDQRRAFQFRVNALGGQAEALLSTAEGFEDWSWDAIWGSRGRIDSLGYTVEVAIPFKSLRFPRTEQVQTWGVILERSYPRGIRHRMQSAPHDRNNTCTLCEANKVTGFQGIAPGRNLELDPAVTGSRTDRRADLPDGALTNGKVDASLGVDFRWGITPNLTLNATGNPDFSQIEADVAQLDVNTRFALFFPEKRPFFLEGADLFSTPIQAVFTRTVADPDAGLKLSGKIGKSSASAFGVFATRDAITNLLFPANQGSSDASLTQEAYSTVGRFRRDIGRSSHFGGLYTGRFGEGYSNQLAGVDVFHQLDRSTSVRLQYLRSLTDYPDSTAQAAGQPDGSFGGGGLHASLNRNTANWFMGLSYSDLSPDFRADLGFVPRVDTRSVGGDLFRIFRRQRGWFTEMFAGVSYGRGWDYEGSLTDESAAVALHYAGPAQSSGALRFAHERSRFASTLFDLNQASLFYSLQPSSLAVLGISGRVGQAIDFTNVRRSNEVNFSPSARLSLGRGLGLDLSHNFQRLSHQGERVFTANLFQAKVIYNFDVRTFVRGIVQYRSVSRNQAKYTVPVSSFDEGLFGQFLFSYKVNPQTVVFVGYSENQAGTESFDLVRSDRTFFVKLGYAWRP